MYRWVDHTAELELHIEASDEAGIFAEALAALRELLIRDEAPTSPAGDVGSDDCEAGSRRGGAPGAAGLRSVTIADGRDRAALLAEWMVELLYLAETEELIPERVASITLADHGLEATVSMGRGLPSQLVKAITYHGLSMARSGERWRATVVLDV
jgi:SHS2 domain-containing protein